MRKETIVLYERDFAYCLAGQLFEQAPNRKPRKAEVIMQKALESFNNYETHAVIFGDMHKVSIEKGELYKFCDKLLKEIPEFNELNLTQNEIDKGITLDDDRPSFQFTSRYDKKDENSWRDDFIDLDAFIQNLVFHLNQRLDLNNDCFLCINQDESSENTLSSGQSDKCKTCKINPNFTNNYETCRQPKGKYTMACNFDCYKAKYICCIECDDKDNCTHKCDSTPDKCNNVTCSTKA